MDDDEEDNDHDDLLGLSDIERTHEERDNFVAFSYANGVEQRYVLNDNPHSFVGGLPIKYKYPMTYPPSLTPGGALPP